MDGQYGEWIVSSVNGSSGEGASEDHISVDFELQSDR